MPLATKKVKKTKTQEEAELKAACTLLERHLRSLGPNVILQLNKDGAELEDTSWPGSSTGETLYEALQDAQIARD